MIKLHKPKLMNLSCAVTNLSILTGLSFFKIRNEILNARSRFPRNYSGHRCKRIRMSNSTEFAYISEIKQILSKYNINVNLKNNNIRLTEFAKIYEKGTYLIFIRDHVTILRNGRIFDNMEWNVFAENSYHYKDKVIKWAKLS